MPDEKDSKVSEYTEVLKTAGEADTMEESASKAEKSEQTAEGSAAAKKKPEVSRKVPTDGIAYGSAAGLAIGIILGLVTGKVAVFVASGAVIGLAAGYIIDCLADKKRKADEDTQSEKPDGKEQSDADKNI